MKHNIINETNIFGYLKMNNLNINKFHKNGFLKKKKPFL